jgi:hypothetical protein
MPCSHLQELFDVAEKHQLKISARDAVRIVCPQCNQTESCPTALTDGEQVVELGDSRGKKSEA